jgi:transcriptional regulator with XRE-family HTH domain
MDLDLARLLREARAAAGLSMRGLAARAGTSASTVARIEAGTMDPTVGMFRRLLLAAGHEVEFLLRPAEARPQLADLSDAWRRGSTGERPDWTRLRAFLDHLALRPENAAESIRRAPARSGSAMLDALLAAIADKIADDHGLPRPRWTSAAHRQLPDLWESPGTPAMRAKARQSTPHQLREHGIAISADSLWRERHATHA